MKPILKNLLFTFLVVTIFFGILEMAQRVRYSVRYESAAWLFYGSETYRKLFSDKYDERHKKQDEEREQEIKQGLKPELVTENVDGIKVFHFKYDIKPTYKKLIPGDYILNKNAIMHVNSGGFRGPEILRAKTKPRIFMMGASSTLGADNNDGKTYPAQTQEILKRSYGRDLEIINGGVGGVNAGEIYHLFREEILDYEPDIVTVYSGYNNWNSKSVEGCGWRSWVFRIKYFLLSKSLLFCTINEKLHLRKGKRVEALWFNPGSAQMILNDRKTWDTFRENLEKMCSLAREHNVKMILMSQPLYLTSENSGTFWEDERLWHKHYELSNGIIRDVADRHNAEFLDVAEVFDQADEGRKKELFTDVVHLTDDGNTVIARMIAKKIDSVLDEENRGE